MLLASEAPSNAKKRRKRQNMPVWLVKWVVLVVAASAVFAGPAAAASRIKDIVDVENVRDNQLIGYGLVVGLKGTGDSLRNAPFTQQSLAAMLERLGVNIRNLNLNTKNVAAVTVTATLPAFSRKGARVDVQVSALGDAESLQGGTLLVTPLVGLDGDVHAVAQGQVAIGGFSAKGAAESIERGVSSAGRIANGAIVEREIAFDLRSMDSVNLSLRNPDFTTAQRIAAAINGKKGDGIATVLDPNTVKVSVGGSRDIVAMMSEIEQLPIAVDQTARVIVNESSGVIVMGSDVKVSKVAIAQGNLTIRITEQPQVSQPNALSNAGQTTTVPRTEVQVDDGKDRKLTMLDSGVSLQDLVDGLNALGVGPRDMISILQALKAAGALQADLEVM
jgi:flagellar P-ring protein FlgI